MGEAIIKMSPEELLSKFDELNSKIDNLTREIKEKNRKYISRQDLAFRWWGIYENKEVQRMYRLIKYKGLPFDEIVGAIPEDKLEEWTKKNEKYTRKTQQ